jgi:hypothetical protein
MAIKFHIAVLWVMINVLLELLFLSSVYYPNGESRLLLPNNTVKI